MNKLICCILIVIPIVGFSQKDTIGHMFTYGTVANDVGEDIAATHDGGFILTGSTAGSGDGNSDIYLLKIDSSCNYQWSLSLGGINNDWGYAVKQTYDKGYIIAASTNSYGNGDYNSMLLKRDSAGGYEWQQIYGGNDWDFAYDVVQAFDSGYVFCGETYNGTAGYSDVYIVKTNSIGDTLWTKVIGGSLVDKAVSLIQTYDSSIVVAGTRTTTTDSTQAYIIKLDKNGTFLWEHEYGGLKHDIANSIIETMDSNYVFVGTTSSFAAVNNDYYLVKINQTGGVIWENVLSSPMFDECKDIVELPTGELMIASQTNSYGGGKIDAILFKLTSSAGWMGKSSTFGQLENEITTGLAYGLNGNMYISGYTNSFGAGLNDLMVIRVDTLVKFQQFDVTSFIDIAPISVAETDKKNIEMNCFPNPSKQFIYVNSSIYPLQLQLLGIQGNILINQIIDSSLNAISLNDIASGTYIIMLSNDEGVLKREKLIVIK